MKLKLTFLTLLVALTLFAQDKKDDPKGASKDWDVNNPPGEGWNWKDVKFTTNEGT